MFGLIRRSLSVLLLLPTLALAQQAAPPAAPAPPAAQAPPPPYADLNRKFQQFEWARQDLTTAIEKVLQEKEQAITDLRQQNQMLQQQLAPKGEASVPAPAP
jgi:hypothetical protein